MCYPPLRRRPVRGWPRAVARRYLELHLESAAREKALRESLVKRAEELEAIEANGPASPGQVVTVAQKIRKGMHEA